ncbi:MAG: hypothetical protein L6R37_006018 [Teloschistes peruensis]|nr:MAG: hypothetical protein L6R37_006018 [Teloschistes peruensis]
MEACYHEIRTISLLQEHPHITAPPKTFVTVTRLGNDQRAFVCGALYPFMEHGTLDDQIQHMAAVEARLPLLEKAKWCFQMASAITHTNFIAHTFHMDIKPANFLLNTHKDLLLIDGEQSGVALYTLAPEADGSWDVKELVAGRTMWMLLEQVTQDEAEERDLTAVSWSKSANDIPADWKDIVGRRLDPDPNERLGLLELRKPISTTISPDGARKLLSSKSGGLANDDLIEPA